MNDTIQMPALTEDLLLVLDEMEDAHIPCTTGQAVMRPVRIGSINTNPPADICGKPASWVGVKPCGHDGYECEDHHLGTRTEERGRFATTCRACRVRCRSEDIVWRRL